MQKMLMEREEDILKWSFAMNGLHYRFLHVDDPVDITGKVKLSEILNLVALGYVSIDEDSFLPSFNLTKTGEFILGFDKILNIRVKEAQS